MKRLQRILSMVLATTLVSSFGGFAGAEDNADKQPIKQPIQADILSLMRPENAPKSTTIHLDNDVPEAQAAEQHTFNQELISSKGDVLNVEFRFTVKNAAMGEGQWATVEQWLKQLVLSSVQYVQADSESLAHVIYDSYRVQRIAAMPGETGMPAWASEDLLLNDIVCTVPFYPELSVDVNGDATRRLQQRLIDLGYLTGKADGYYGENTRDAVMRLEEYVRDLEQDEINAALGVTPSPAPTATPAPEDDDEKAKTDDEPTAQPGPTPMTVVDGVADGLLQAYLYSDDFKPARADMAVGDEGSDVTRLQTRLNALGYTTDAADGIYGGGTARALRIFQYYSGLDQTGIADGATQALLFSGEAKAPDNAMLTMGSSGDDVSRLQKRLRILGFASIAVDGGYGASTKAGVENLQQYMREMEGEALAATLPPEAVEPAQLTVEVNGVADPLLLDDFYSDSFPAVPDEMATGSEGRDVVRLQRRLSCLEYYYDGLDGQYGSGTVQAVSDFQRRNDLPETGVADRDTMAALFNENARKALKPYILKVSVDDQRVYAYAPDRNGEYTDLVRTMKCSTGRKGTPTPKGTFTDTAPGARWHFFKKFNCWAQYAFYIQGDIMFHSVLYSQKGGSVTQSSVNHLGSRASHGCVRLSVEDAKWIWNNCPANTRVEVY
ncbi:MAG: peptidoglycan-binding protein [Clostridia bacterium]|nr:peptidoglycan-binding protein [Clostridia bacterium]